eukprot:9388700-Pyramimonas_sp.AAC.1
MKSGGKGRSESVSEKENQCKAGAGRRLRRHSRQTECQAKATGCDSAATAATQPLDRPSGPENGRRRGGDGAATAAT